MAKVKKGPQGAVTTAAHKARRIAKEQRKQAKDATLRPARAALRKLGALRRLDRRILAAKDAGVVARLVTTRSKVFASMQAQAA